MKVSKAESGLVIEADLKTALVLTPTGEFLTVKMKKGAYIPSVGEEYIFENSKQNFLFKYAAVAAVFLLFVLLPFAKPAITTSFSNILQIDSYLVVDINPSIELGLDKSNHVKSVSALNKDANSILFNQSLIGKSVDYALEQIMKAAIELGYLKNEEEPHNVLLTYVPVKNEGIDPEKLTTKVKDTLEKQRVIAEVETLVSTESIRQAAKKLGVSAGKYIVLLEAHENGLDISPQEIKANSLSKTITSFGGDLNELLDQAKSEKDMMKLEEKHLKQIKKEVKKENSKNQKNKVQGKIKQEKELKRIKLILRIKIITA